MVRRKGVDYYRQLAGGKAIQRSHTNQSLLNELHIIVNKLGHFPKQREINKSLQSAIFRRGGLEKFEQLYDAEHNPTYTINKKKCSKCQSYLEHNKFATSKYHKDGLYSICRLCKRQS